MKSRRPSELRSIAFALILTLSAASTIGAEEPQEGSTGDTFTTVGKYQEMIGDHLRLVNDPREFLLKRDEHRRKVLELTSYRDNLKLDGIVVPTPRGKVLEVVTLEIGADDTALYRERKAAALRGHDDEKADALLKLALDAAAHWRTYGDPRVLELGQESLGLALASMVESATPERLKETLNRIVEAREIVGAEAVVLQALNALESRFQRDPEIARVCRRLGCRRHNGHWIGYNEFKKLEGFVWYGGRWMKPHEKHLAGAIEAFQRTLYAPTVCRRRTEREYSLLAERGSVVLGMKPEEVSRAIGPPDRVERRLVSQKEFDQWIYEGGEYFYFYDSCLVQLPR